ncbi:MAG: tRNA uridine(34) 5-carboxymethylaminomethyl modification radical SAM/GNAT enzyme Elp3 [Candidatus Microgenomates bacterium]
MTSLSELIHANLTLLTPTALPTLKRVLGKALGKTPRDSDIRAVYLDLIKSGKLKNSPDLLRLLTTREVRTLSGVTPFAVMMKAYTCPGRCTFCPLELGMPKSYLSDEPAAARAKMMNFDPRRQIESRLNQLEETGHVTDKIELIVIGGTFGSYPDSYKRSFFKDMIDTINGVVSETLEDAQVYNETAKRRIVGISVETRPDWIDAKEVKLFRELGVTKVQVGVQAFDEDILKRVKRGHSLNAVAVATQLLKDAGIKVCYHFMPNLPGSNPTKDVEMARLMYEDPRFKPDFLKVYPSQVIPKTELYEQWKQGEYQPYSDDLLKDVLKNICKITPPYVRIDRLVRDISRKWVAAGTHTTNMRQYVEAELIKEGTPCQCIRCREVKAGEYDVIPELINRELNTLGGKEHLLTFEKDQKIYSLLRLRLPDFDPDIISLFPELAGCAIIREVHTYGKTLSHQDKSTQKIQHQGLGKRLMQEAESLVKKAGYKKIAVISSIGTREYYRSLGYGRVGLYMVKDIDQKG